MKAHNGTDTGGARCAVGSSHSELLYSHNHDQLYKHIIHIHLHMHAES